MTNDNHLWPRTKITELLKITFPIIQAPMAGGITTPELVAAVSNAGGLGSLGAGYMTPDEIKIAIRKIKSLTENPFAVNLFIPEKHHANDNQINQARNIIQLSCPELNFIIPPIHPPYIPSFEEQMKVILEEKISIFSFTFGMLSKNWVEIFRNNNILVIGTATSLEEAKHLEKNGVNAIVAQGSEAGGHRGTFLGNPENALVNLSELTASFVKNIKLPIIAAGGMMEAQGIIDALMLGASAIQMGTAFLCCPESNIHPLYKECLLNTSKDQTSLTRAFSGKLARGITNKFIKRMQAHENNILDYPIQNTLTRSMRKEAFHQNNIDFMSMWAGQNAFLCKKLSAKDLIEELNHQIMSALSKQSVHR